MVCSSAEGQRMKIVRIAIALLFAGAPCLAQTGTVTFYSDAMTAGVMAKSMLPKGQQPFFGWLFDGKQRLAHMRAGRLMTFDFGPGEHSFSVPWKSKGPCTTRLDLHVENGKHYCVRLYANFVNFMVIPYERLDSQIVEVPCAQAAQSPGTFRSLEINRVDPAARSQLDAVQGFSTSN
jgi:hypothetical protein